ncbi:MAG: antibiotic biosynthesis monooxygenase [Saprospiraceae bacterium]|nr:antibiotic biosynthesis monooxygenase [Saprospiraceae bacterium]MDW8484745.1 antibiotic biosynthesis monooxygenase family protein [Saprospiraceae bacterium]
MIKRIVKMTFRPEGVEVFLNEIFEESKSQIRAFPGCRHMELLQAINDPRTLFTWSIWDNESALEHYRQSELFQRTWARTKALFAQPAEAWSVRLLDEAPSESKK